MKNEEMYYMGSEQSGRCLVCVYKDSTQTVNYNEFQEFVEQLGDGVIVRKCVFVDDQELELDFICDYNYYIGIANRFAKEHECEIHISNYDME